MSEAEEWLQEAREFTDKYHKEISRRILANDWLKVDPYGPIPPEPMLPAVFVPESIMAAMVADLIREERLKEAQWWHEHVCTEIPECYERIRALEGERSKP